MVKPRTINKITASWNPMGRMPEVSSDGSFSMRDMQAQAYSQLKGQRYAILNAPTSSGKTLAICWLGAEELRNEPSLKLIISVPQTVIGEGFRGFYDLSYEDQGMRIGWSPCHYLCSPTPESNVSQIVSFLSRRGNKLDINDRVLVCSHASLVNAFDKHKDLFANVRLCIDEMHHSKFTETEDNEYCNQLGRILSYALRKKEKNIKLLLSTATPFRGDRIEVIPKKYLGEFQSFYYPMDEYLKDCEYLKSFSYDFAMYNKSWGKRLKDIFKDKIGKTIIYLPSVGSKYYSYGSKHADVQEIYRAIAGRKKPVIKEREDGLILIQKGDRWIKVVNLVDEGAIREKRKQLIIDAHKHSTNSKIDVIITLNMFREGANWKWADKGIIIGTKGSLTDMVQIIGRFFRDAKNKTKVKIIQLLPYRFDQLDKEKFRDNLNEYSKVIFATMLLEDAIAPVHIKVPVKKNKGGDSCENFKIEIDHLKRQTKDENHYLKIWEEIRDKAIILQGNGLVDFNTKNKKSKEKFQSIVDEILADNGIKHHHTDIADYIWKRWIRESIKGVNKLSGIDLSEVDFDTIDVNPLQFWLTYTSGMLGLGSFREFRNAVAAVRVEESLAVTHPELAKEWDYEKNGDLTPDDVTSGSGQKIWWKCFKNGHPSYLSFIVNRTNLNSGCPFCSGRQVVEDKSLAILFPEIAKGWHPIKNGNLTPCDVGVKSDKLIWWKCNECGCEWELSVYNRVKARKASCPHCMSLAFKYPILIKEWHPTKNGNLTPYNITYGSGKKIWWICDKGHEWTAPVCNRTKGHGCPYCKGIRIFKKVSFVEGLELAHKLGFANREEYKEWVRNNLGTGLPLCPDRAYHSEWCGWAKWLGK